jgi:hypothetical protein
MDYFAGLDVSVKETSVCIVDDTGKIVREARVASEPEALLAVLKNLAYHFKRIGLEAGPLSQWLFSALAEAGCSTRVKTLASGSYPSGRKGYRRIAPSSVRVRLHIRHRAPPPRAYSRRQLFANASMPASRVAAYP